MGTRGTRALVLVAALGVVALGAGLLTSRAAGGGSGGSLPQLGGAAAVEDDDVGDPFVLTVPATPGQAASYVLFWTTDWRSNVPTAVSSDLRHWHRVADALPRLPSWATPSRTMTWGPSALQVAGGWELYFSTQEQSSGLECLGSAFASSPTGPYRDDSPRPLACQRSLGGDIDPSVTRDAAGVPLLVWKNDGNARGLPSAVWEQPLGADGSTLVGTPHRLLTADQPWEDGIIEGPALLRDTGGGWWLFFSGGQWRSNTYDTGVAWCATVSGPCHDASPMPLLISTPKAVSPGGFDTFTDAAGKVWASYSAFPSTPADARAALAENRVLEIAPVLSH